MEQLFGVGALLFIGLAIGAYNEQRHLKSLRERERATLSVKLNNLKKIDIPNGDIVEQRLAVGGTVVSIDYFKLIVAGIKSLFGGRLRGIESLVSRARREAVLRMKEDAIDYNLIVNVRIETSSISSDIGRRSVGSIEVLAYGTAIKTLEG
ncbi:YbjQ family protein [Halobacteriovorax sp.]|uniref:YbjQ family protein n=1 Tax=Halobacteriovorax sp. TaxID=2020862 RepID=UPI00356641A1